MSNVKRELIPVVKGANGTMSKSLGKYLNKQSRNYRKQPYWAPHFYFRKY